MRIILDTNVLWNKAAMEKLQETAAPVVVPAVVVAERARQYAKRGWPVSRLLDQLAANQFTSEALTPEMALRFAPGLVADDAWRRLARDALIAGHVQAGDVLWTSDVKDFLEIGVPMDRLQAV